MSTEFLTNFMHLAQTITEAERAAAFDTDLQVVAVQGVETAVVESEPFKNVAHSNLRAAREQGKAVWSNNLFQDPAEAPQTNTSFDNLRMVVVIPVPDTGAIYLDQHIRQGVIIRDDVDRLSAFCARLMRDGKTDLSLDAMRELYESGLAGQAK